MAKVSSRDKVFSRTGPRANEQKASNPYPAETSAEVKSRSFKLMTHLHMVSRHRICGASEEGATVALLTRGAEIVEVMDVRKIWNYYKRSFLLTWRPQKIDI
jgi:hypothetical protein